MLLVFATVCYYVACLQGLCWPRKSYRWCFERAHDLRPSNCTQVEVPPDAMSANVVRLEELGHGATGCVYKAVHATSLQLLAVKEVRVPLSRWRLVAFFVYVATLPAQHHAWHFLYIFQYIVPLG